MLKKRIPLFVTDYKFLLVIYMIITMAASIGQYLKSKPTDAFSKYNNYLIFRQSFPHLVEGVDMYISHEPEYFDLYKYSPGFAVLMAPFNWVPDLPGLITWNLINTLALFCGIYFLPFLKKKGKIFMLWFILVELLTSLQNAQSNGLIAGLLVLSLVQFEKKNVLLASLFIVFSAYIKIFGIAAVVLALFYPDKIKFILYSILWAVLFTFIPLLFTSWDLLMMQYKGWYHIIALDNSINYGISVFGILHSWFSVDNKNIVVLSGLLILMTPLLFIKRYKEYDFRISFFSSLLLWIVIFNHRGESPTFVIAVTGAAIWFFSESRKNLDVFLLVLVFVLTCLSPTDLFPRSWRNDWVVPYSLKALPCVLVWIKINVDLFFKQEIKGQ